MQDKFKVGDYVIFRRFYGDVCRMLDTSFYDVLNSVYEIIGTEGRCYLLKSDNGRGRMWKIRKSRIDRLGSRVTITNDVAVVMDDECERKHDAFEWQGFRLVRKSDAKREQRRSHELFDDSLYPWVSGSVDASDRLLQKRAKEYVEELANANAAKRKELADAFVKDVEQMIKGAEATMKAMCRVFDRCRVREKLDAYDIDINNLKGGEE